ncbi:hypothetical protein EJP617_10150 [Erwinia sp. Ejp617]|nr:hypothetical protein EJP617_10150 [Erwinia sp. Ejp617]
MSARFDFHLLGWTGKGMRKSDLVVLDTHKSYRLKTSTHSRFACDEGAV